MQAQHHLETTRERQDAAVARRLIEANALYARANNGAFFPGERAEARCQAREALQDVLALASSNADALNLLGRIDLDEGHTTSAHDLFSLAVEADPESAQARTNLGYWALMEGEPAQARKYFEQALQLDRQSATAFAGIAHACQAQGYWDTAFLHYRRLLELGADWPSVYSGMMECARRLEIHRASEELVTDAIRLLRNEELPHQNLGTFAATILRLQYQQIEGEALLEKAARDELLHLALEKTLLPDPELERVITNIRTQLVHEVDGTGELADSRQRLALALGLYGTRTGFAQAVSEREHLIITNIDTVLIHELANRPAPDAVAGALIIRSLYGSLFHQPYAPQIGAYNLEDWPEGMQPLMAASFYHKAEEEAYKQGFEEKQEELALAKADLPHAWPCWHNLTPYTAQPIKQELSNSLGISTDHWPETVRLFVIGAGSGQRAIELASYFTDVEVVAVDEELANLAHGNRRARERGLENIVFWPYSLANRFIHDGNQVQMVEVGTLPSERLNRISVDEIARHALGSGGLLHIHTGEHGSSRMDVALRRMVERHRLAPTTETIRRLRRMILNNPEQDAYQEMLQDPDFYAIAGCRRRWFFPEDQNQLLRLMDSLSNEVDWKLLRARDTDGQDLATGPVLKQLQAQSYGNRVQSLVGQGLSLYFQRRR